MTQHKNDDLKNIICLVVISIMAFILLHDICGSSLLGHSYWNSYELQAEAWLNGKTYLDENYSRLELALFNGKVYVSFPPFPSVVMLPFVIVFGANNTPNNLVIAAVCIITVILAYKILRRCNTDGLTASFIALFYVFGSNMLSMALCGGVWFMAQALNMLLCTMAVGFALNNKRIWAYIMLGFAVGCRPFSAIYIIAFFVYFMVKDMTSSTENKKITFDSFLKTLVSNIAYALPLLIIAAIYMLYNYARFNNPFEFGHNYLPEFTESEHGQFSSTYLLENLRRLFVESVKIDSDLNISFTKFNGFLFYVANPIFLIAAYRSMRDIIKKRRISYIRLGLTVAILLNILLLCMHKTLGGWQFGARYTCDFIPFAFIAMLTTTQINKPNRQSAPLLTLKSHSEVIQPLTLNRFEIITAVFGIMFNAFGAVELWLHLI